MNFLITEGAGFIGSNIAERILTLGNEVRILDNFSTGREENLSDFISDVELIRGDFRDLDVVSTAVTGMDYNRIPSKSLYW